LGTALGLPAPELDKIASRRGSTTSSKSAWTAQVLKKPGKPPTEEFGDKKNPLKGAKIMRSRVFAPPT